MNISAWLKGHKPEAALGAGGIVVTIVLAYRARQKNAATGAGSSSSAAYPASTGMPVSTADTTQSDAFTGLEDQVVGLQSALLALQNPAQTPPPGAIFQPAPAPVQQAPTAPAPQPGFGDVPTAQGEMIDLGVWGHPIYQVSGGAPVYFGNASSLAQGPAGEVAGNEVYTPVAYGAQVSKAPS